MDHEKYMKECLKLGEEALQNGNPPVGSLVVSDGKIIGKARETAATTGRITDHAEILAIIDAIENGHRADLSKSVLYTTHEPCIMCSYPIRQYRIPVIVFGLAVEHIGGATSNLGVLRTEKVPQWGQKPEIIQGICIKECEALQLRFLEKKKKR